MGYCRSCSEWGLFLSTSDTRLCRRCQQHLDQSDHDLFEQVRKLAFRCLMAETNGQRIQACSAAIDAARQALPYERKGIQTLDPTPSMAIRMFEELSNRFRSVGLSDTFAAVLREVEQVPAGVDGYGRTTRAIAKAVFESRCPPPRIIAVINQKGGVGKTTTTISLGAGLASLGKKVLLVDFDPQANMTEGLGIAPAAKTQSIYHVVKGFACLSDARIQRSTGLWIVPASMDLAQLEREPFVNPRTSSLFRRRFEGVTGYDFILIDCPPSLGILTINALTAANEIFIPLQAEYFALQGIRKLLVLIEYVRKSLNPGLAITGIVGTRVDTRKILHLEVLRKVRECLGDALFPRIIRENIAIAEASSYGKTIFEYQPASHGCEDYLAVSREIIRRTERQRAAACEETAAAMEG